MSVHILLENIAFYWPEKGGEGSAGRGFSGVHLALMRGDFALLRGPSGEGKSTLLRLLVRFEEPQEGRIFLAGEDIHLLAPNVLRRRVGLVPQSPVMGAVTVREALLLPFTFAGNADTARPEDAHLRHLLDTMHLHAVPLEAEAEALSLGQKQRVALARTLLLKPEVLLLDEPTSALDVESREAVEAQVEAANSAGTTVLMVTHTDYGPAHTRAREFLLRDGRMHESTGAAHE